MVVLNGCSTEGQVAALLEQGIPCVIATSAPVNDSVATQFGIRFFQALKEQATIGEAFELAKGEALTTKSIDFQRGIGFKGDKKSKKPIWGIFYKEEKATVLEEKLPVYIDIATPEDYVPNEKLISTLLKSLAPFNEEVEELYELSLIHI